MKRNKNLLLLVLVATLNLPAIVFGLDGAPLSDERDQQVLQALLLHLRADTNFNLTRTQAKPPKIVLHIRTPEKTGFLSASQIHSELGQNILPSDAENNLRARNTKADAPPDSFEAATAFYTNLTFSTNIVVADLGLVRSSPLKMRAFAEAYPEACGFVRAYLPGYSTDGNTVVVRASVGPTPHGASVTALLEKTGNTWTVKWYKLAVYV